MHRDTKDNDLPEVLLKFLVIFRDGINSVDKLTSELRAWRARIEMSRCQGDLVTPKQLAKTERHIMEAIQTFAARVEESFNKIGLAVDGVAMDVEKLKETIEKLQNSPGGITPEDQALLDRIESLAEGLANKIQTLDAATEESPTPV